MSRQWSDWIHDAVEPSADEVAKLVKPVDDERMAWVREATAPTDLELQHLLARRPAPARGSWLPTVLAIATVAAGLWLVAPMLSADRASGVQVVTGEEVWVGHEAMSLGPSVEVVGTARVRVDAVGPSGTVVQVLEGKARFDVQEAVESEVLVNVGDLSFRGFGNFEIVRTGDVTRVEIFSGELVVRELGRQVRLTTGSVRTFQPGEVSRAAQPDVEWAPLSDTDVDDIAIAAVEAIDDRAIIKPAAPKASPEKAPMVRPKLRDVIATIPPDTTAWLAVQDLLDRDAPPGLMRMELDRFISTYPGSRHRPEAEYYRLVQQAQGARDSHAAIKEINDHLRAYPNSPRAPDLRFLVATVYRDRLRDCHGALPHYRAVAGGAHGELSTRALAWWALCEHALGRGTAPALLERASHNDLPPALLRQIQDAMKSTER